MNYKDIINNFLLKLNKHFSTFKFEEDELVLDIFRRIDALYNNIQSYVSSIEKLLLENTQRTADMLSNYDILVSDEINQYKSDRDNYTAIKTFNIDNLNQSKDLQIKKIDETKIGLDNKMFIAKSRARDKINNIDIEKNLNNISLRNFLPNIVNKYNLLISTLNNDKQIKNNKSHASISRELHTYLEANTSLIENLKVKLSNVESSISIIKYEIEDRNRLTENIIYDKTVALNKKVLELATKYNGEKKLNEIQADLEKTSLLNELNVIKEKYNKERQLILKELQDNLTSCDDKIDEFTKDYNESINKYTKSYQYERFRKEKYYNALILKNFDLVKLNPSYHKQAKRENKIAYKKLLQFDLFYKNRILDLENTYKKNCDDLKQLKYYYDVVRKHKIALVEIYEEIETYSINKKIALSEYEKKAFDEISDNKLSIDVNNIKIKHEIEVLNSNTSFKAFETSRGSSIAMLERKLNDYFSDIRFSQKLEEILRNRYSNEDELNKKLHDLNVVLTIEKNKYLVKYNEEIINHKTILNNIYHDYLIRNTSLEKDKEIDSINSTIKYDFNALDNYIREVDLKIELEKISYNHNISLTNAKEIYNQSNSKSGMHKKKLNLDYILINGLKDNVNRLIRFIQGILWDYINEIIQFVGNHLTNSERIIKFLNELMNYFIEFYITLIEAFCENLVKILEFRISFELGTKYDLMINEVKNSYEIKKNALMERKASLENTISNYQTTLHSYYRELRLLEIRKEFASKNKISVDEYKQQIGILLKKINKTNLLKKNLSDATLIIPKRINVLNNALSKDIDKVLREKNKDVALSNMTIHKIVENSSLLIDSIKKLYNPFKFEQLVIFENIKNDLNRIDKTLNIYVTKYFQSLDKDLRDYYVHETKNINNIKKDYYNSYQISLKSIEYEFNRLSKQVNSKIEQNREELLVLTNKYKNEQKKLDDILRFKLSASKRQYTNDYDNENLRFNQFEIKQYKIFDAIDQNLNNIISKSIMDFKKNEDEYKNLTSKLVNKELEFKQECEQIELQNKNSARKTLLLIPKYRKKQTQKITLDFENLNAKRTLNIKEISKNIKLDNKNALFEIDEYKKQKSKEINKENRSFSNEVKAIKKKFNFKQNINESIDSKLI